MLPLDDLLVLDFSTLLPGPLASLFLSEAGARVIKIERPGGEDMRGFPPRFGETAAPFAVLNRGKESVELDLKAPDALARLTPLITNADILIEQFRPGVMERLGFGHEALKAINPRLIYCSISGYGQQGPRAQEAGHDINYQALGGLLGQSLKRGEAPPLPPPLVADIAGGTMPAGLNSLRALLRTFVDRGHTMIIISHSMRFLGAVADNVLFMDGGLVVEQGPADQVFNSPSDPRTKEFLEQAE